MPSKTHKPQGKAKRLTEAERLIIHAERKQGKKTTRQIAQEYGVSNSTVTDIEHNEVLSTKLAKSDHIKRALSANLYIAAQDSLDCITPARLEKVNAYQNAIITATLVDKARLIDGNSTSNIDLRLDSTQLQRMLEVAKDTMPPVIDITPANTQGKD